MTDFPIPHGHFLIAPDAKDWAESLAKQMASAEFAAEFNQKVTEQAASANGDFWTELGQYSAYLRPYRVDKQGTLTVPVKGMLMKGFPFAWGGMATGYEYINAANSRGVSDEEVNRIVLEINSPGGGVAGCFDCADAIYTARGAKPIMAVADEFAYSAAYAIASSADRIAVARTGGVGSIGVMSAHIDMTSALERNGVKITPIFAGAQKADGQPFVPLSEEAKARMQERINAIYDIFVSTVARNRGLDEQTVRGTEAAVFMAPQAVEMGLADAVGSLDSLSASADQSNDDEDIEMSKENQMVAQADHETAVAAAAAEANTEGHAAGRAAERERIAAILDSEEAKSHPAAARHVALNTDMSAADAGTFLKALPAETPAAAAKPGDQFEKLMDESGNPNLGAGGQHDDTKADVVDSIFASAGFAKAKS